ncbi:MAG: hypothetical protein EOP64_01080 [Sphingomonas sp.]|jgi:hypothetical protein|nr:MAG: hypothetical protein EOP64_01080 [Sphingomonas sp.]
MTGATGSKTMVGDDQAYFYKRAEIELKRARQATCPEASTVHSQLAKAYLARIPLLALDSTIKAGVS